MPTTSQTGEDSAGYSIAISTVLLTHPGPSTRNGTLVPRGPLGTKTFVIRTPPVGEAGRALQAVGVALGPSVRLAD